MGRSARRGDDEEVLVELVDVGADPWPSELGASDDGGAATDGTAGADLAATEPGATTTPRRRPRPAVLVAAGIVALVLAAGGALQARTDAALAARLASVDGAVADLSRPLEVLWEVDEAWPVGASGDVVVLQTYRGALQGVDARTGEVVWRDDPAQEEHCRPVDVTGRGSRASGHLVCTPVSMTTGAPVRVTFRDAATGGLIGAVDGTGHVVDVVVHDGLVLVVMASDDEARAVAWDPRTGESEERWRRTGDETAGYDGSETVVQVVDGVLVLGVWNAEQTSPDDMVTPLFAVDLGTGDPVEPPPSSTLWTWEAEVGDGVRAVTRLTADGPTVRLVRDDGTFVGEHPGELWLPSVDDRTGDVLLLRLGSRVRALDLATGVERWANPDVKDTALARVDGVLVAGGDSGISGYDVTTGEELWTVDGSNLGFYTPTDGRRVLVERAGEEGPVITALDLHDGHEVWSAEHEGGGQVFPLGGQVLLLRTDGSVAALG